MRDDVLPLQILRQLAHGEEAVSAHAHHEMHPNSVAAYRAEESKLSKRAQAIYDYVERAGPRTDREVMAGMGFTDPNSVRPRITELIEANKLMEVGDVMCPVTKRHVRRVDVRRPRWEQQELRS